MSAASAAANAIPKTFWSSPYRYLRWAAYEKTAIFWSCIMGAMGPTMFVIAPPLRRWAGDEDPPRIPLTYPVPKGPRKVPSGFEDPK